MSVSVHPAMGLHQNGIVGEKLAAQQVIPLDLLTADLELERKEEDTPLLSHGQHVQYMKEEDFAVAKTDCERVPGDPSTAFAAFMVFDGHNGPAAAIYSKENLLKDVLGCIPPGLSREEWLNFLPRAMVAGFVKTDKDWQQLGQTSGTTATLAIVDGWTVTVACVGDSRCVLDAQRVATALTIDHRLDGNDEEYASHLETLICVLVLASSLTRMCAGKNASKLVEGEVARIRLAGGVEVGPLRVWPGGLCLSRSIGDMDVGEYIVAVPHVKQIKLAPEAGGRLIIASDGVWDAVSVKRAARCCRGVQRPEIAAKYVVKEAIRSRGLRDDTTCLVVDLAPRGLEHFAPAMKKSSSFMNLLRCTSVKEGHVAYDTNSMEELFDENSHELAERLGPEASVHAGNMLFVCAMCHTRLEADSGISVHAGSFFSQLSAAKAWQGPFLCAKCSNKQDAGAKDDAKPADDDDNAEKDKH